VTNENISESKQITSPEIIKNEINSEYDNIKPLFKLLNKERINITEKLHKLACLIKLLFGDDGINLLLEISRKSKLYQNDEWIIKEYELI